MTQEEKELLLKDLCARLPYGVQAQVDGHINPLQILGISKLHKSTWAWKRGTYVVSFWNDTKAIENIKQYLRPMSSMTQEECRELRCIIAVEPLWVMFDFFYSHHIDFRDLIPKGLALEAPEGMYETK